MELIFGHTHTQTEPRTEPQTDGWTDRRGSRNSYLDEYTVSSIVINISQLCMHVIMLSNLRFSVQIKNPSEKKLKFKSFSP